MQLPVPQPKTPLAIRLNVLLVILVVIMATFISVTGLLPRLFGGSGTPRAITPRGDLSDLEKSSIALFEAASPSVVFVTSIDDRQNRLTMEIESFPRGSGSGFIWDASGHIVTNYHVIEGARRLIVTLSNGQSYSARRVGASQLNDLAVLRITPPLGVVLPPIPVGESASLRVGQEAYAIGNPFGLDQTLTRGIISALHRTIQQSEAVILRDLIQTDAAINPGNSGGPLLDSAGRLIGVNTAIFSPARVNAGIGFAVPVDTVNRVVPDLIARDQGREPRPQLGVVVSVARDPRPGGQSTALRIRDVVPQSPAAKAGLKADRLVEGRPVIGDYILEVNGVRIETVEILHEVLDNQRVGREVTLKIWRAGETMEVPVVLEALGIDG